MTRIPVYTIDTGIPIPKSARRSKYMLNQLEVGDSILVAKKNRGSAASSASHLKQRTGKEFVTRQVDEGNVRIWRTK